MIASYQATRTNERARRVQRGGEQDCLADPAVAAEGDRGDVASGPPQLGHSEDVEHLLTDPGPAEEPGGVVRTAATPVHLACSARLDHQRGAPGGQGRLDLGA